LQILTNFEPIVLLYDRLMARYCHLSVRQSVCRFVTKCTVALRVGVGRWKLYRRVPRTALRTYQTLLQKPNYRNFRVWNIHGQCCHETIVIADTAFSTVRFCSYTDVRRTQCDRPS